MTQESPDVSGAPALPRARAVRDRLLRLAPRAIGFLLLFGLLFTLDWERARILARAADPALLAGAAAGNLAFILAKSLRWWSILRIQGVRCGLGWTLRVYQAGSFFSVLTPGKVGDFVKVGYLHEARKATLAKGLAGVVVDRVLDLLALAGTALVVIFASEASHRFLTSILAFCGLVLAGLLLLLSKGWAKTLLAIVEPLPVVGRLVARVRGLLSEIYREFAGMKRTAVAGPIALTLVAYLGLYSGSFALALALGLPLTPFNVVYCVTVANVVSLLPVSVSGLGTRDLAMVVLFASLGIGRSDAVVFSVGYFLMSLIFGNGLGGYYWWRYPIRLSAFLRRPGKKEVESAWT